MNNTERELMFTQVAVDLRAINSSTSPYTNDIQLVSRDALLPSQFVGAMPGISINDKGDELLQNVSSGLRIWKAHAVFFVWATSQPGMVGASMLNSLGADVIYALTAPTLRAHPASGSDTCIHTEVTGHDTFMSVEGDAIHCVAIKAEFTYQNTWTEL